MYASLTPEDACEALRIAGIMLTPSHITIDRRDVGWAVTLPDNRMAWFPADEKGARQLGQERKIFKLLNERCSFQVPEIIFESDDFEVRALIVGNCDPWPLYARVQKDPSLALRTGRRLGEILVEQHTKITNSDVGSWISKELDWPEKTEWLRKRIDLSIKDRALLSEIENAISLYEAIEITNEQKVLVHGDLGLHNTVVEEATDNIIGVFDYKTSAWTDRHHDFRYLLFDLGNEENILNAALDVYEPSVGVKLNRSRIRLYNAICAISFLASRGDTPADEKYAGRTLAEDLNWTRVALARLAR